MSDLNNTHTHYITTDATTTTFKNLPVEIWREIERDGEREREMEGERWREMERDGER